MADTCHQCPEGMILKEGKCVLPEVTFETFIMSLNQAALCHLGELADPETGERSRDLSLAKHTIDTLAMLQKKRKATSPKTSNGSSTPCLQICGFCMSRQRDRRGPPPSLRLYPAPAPLAPSRCARLRLRRTNERPATSYPS